jgi:hypothetical protein
MTHVPGGSGAVQFPFGEEGETTPTPRDKHRSAGVVRYVFPSYHNEPCGLGGDVCRPCWDTHGVMQASPRDVADKSVQSSPVI